MVTKTQAMNARHFEHVKLRNGDGSPLRVRATGKCQTWKTRPADFKLPVKYGLRDSLYITPDNADQWRVEGSWKCHRCGDEENERDHANCNACGEPRRRVEVYSCATGNGWQAMVNGLTDTEFPYYRNEKAALAAAREKYPDAVVTTYSAKVAA